MKHLVQVMAVFLLMGCQTNNNIPKDTISPTPIAKNVETETAPDQQVIPDAVQINKPIICGNSTTVVAGLIKNTAEQPVMIWDDEIRKHKVIVMMNKETRTVTVLEWPMPKLACMISTGVNGSFNGLPDKKETRFKVSH